MAARPAAGEGEVTITLQQLGRDYLLDMAYPATCIPGKRW